VTSNLIPFEDHDPLPFLRTRRIVVGRESVKIECLLSTRSGQAIDPMWFQVGEFAEFVKFYFVITGLGIGAPDNPTGFSASWPTGIASTVMNPKTRVAALRDQGYYRNNMFHTGYSPIENAQYSAKVISLSEILLYNDENIMNNAGLNTNDIYFEVEIPLELTPVGWTAFNLSIQGYNSDTVSLIAFSHLDVAALEREWNLAGSAGLDGLLKIGGNMVYDTVLVRNASRWAPTPTRKVFTYVQSGTWGGATFIAGQQYSGPAHEHTAASPAKFQPGSQNERRYGTDPSTALLESGEPDPGINLFPGPGYTGWMAGSSHNGDSDQPLLIAREIENHKIVAPAFLDDFGFQSDFFGADTLYDVEDGGSVLVGLEVPPSLEERLKDAIDPVVGVSESQLDILRHYFFEKYYAKNTLDFVMDKESWIGTPEFGQRSVGGWHSIFFGIDYYKTIYNNSRYGFILENIRSAFGDSHETITEILNLSDLKEIRILRRRLSNWPTGNNLLGSNDYQYFDLEESDSLLISSKDRETIAQLQRDTQFRNNLEPRQNDRASISEVDVQYDRDSRDNPDVSYNNRMRSFFIKDFDMFRNINYGKYTYIVELQIKDGIKEYLYKQLRDFSRLVEQFANFIVTAGQPYLGNPKDRYYGSDLWQAEIYGIPVREAGYDEVAEGTYIGNYDYNLGEFTHDFKINHGYNPLPLIESFIKLNKILGNYNAQLGALAYMAATLPQTGNINTMESFHKQCQRLSLVYEKLLEKDKYTPARSRIGNLSHEEVDPKDGYYFCENSLTGQKVTKTPPRNSSNHIFIRSDMRFVVSAIRENDVLVDWGNVAVSTVSAESLRRLPPHVAQRLQESLRPEYPQVPFVEALPNLPFDGPGHIPTTGIPDFSATARALHRAGQVLPAPAKRHQSPDWKQPGRPGDPIYPFAQTRSDTSQPGEHYSRPIEGMDPSEVARQLQGLAQPSRYYQFGGGRAKLILDRRDITRKTPAEQGATQVQMGGITAPGMSNNGAMASNNKSMDAPGGSQSNLNTPNIPGFAFGLVGGGVAIANPYRNFNIVPDEAQREIMPQALESALCSAATKKDRRFVFDVELLQTFGESVKVFDNLRDFYFDTVNLINGLERAMSMPNFNVQPMNFGPAGLGFDLDISMTDGLAAAGMNSALGFETAMPLGAGLTLGDEYFGSRMASISVKTGPGLGVQGGGSFARVASGGGMRQNAGEGPVRLARVQHTGESNHERNENTRMANDVGFMGV